MKRKYLSFIFLVVGVGVILLGNRWMHPLINNLTEFNPPSVSATPPGGYIESAEQAKVTKNSKNYSSESPRPLQPNRRSDNYDRLVSDQLKTDQIPSQSILKFNDIEQYNKFLNSAKNAGLTILDRFDNLRTILVQTDNVADLKDFFTNNPIPFSVDSNYNVYNPDIPSSKTASRSGNYGAFGNEALAWLGINSHNSEWGDGVLVAVLDTGIQQHDSIDSSRVMQIDLLNSGDDSSGPYAGHGTAVASILGGTDQKTPGIAPKVDILSLRVLDSNGYGDSFTLAKGIITAVDLGADELVMSLGTYGNSQILEEAINYATSHDVAIVAAAGNDGADHVMYPAKYDGVVAVGAVDSKGQLLWFSNQGEEIDITAPGYGIHAAWTDNQVAYVSGTSFAVPYVAGAIAEEISRNNLSTEIAIDSVLNNSNDAGPPDADPMFGEGILNMERILNQDLPGIYDIAVADYYFPDTQETAISSFGITFQNQGTETLQGIDMLISYNGNNEHHFVPVLATGESIGISTSFDVSKLRPGSVAHVTASADSINNFDTNPTNNQRLFEITLPATEIPPPATGSCPRKN